MNELKNITMWVGNCAECERHCAGVRFGFLYCPLDQTQFLCWEHFRLLQEAMKPQRVEVQRVTEIISCGCCCHHHSHSWCCGCGHRRSYGWSHGETQSDGMTRSIGISRFVSTGISENHTGGISNSRTMGQSDGSSSGHSECRGSLRRTSEDHCRARSESH